jgi:hypothetical protein
MKESEVTKTLNEWELEFENLNLHIMDPDGFDRKNLNLYSEKFTLSQFIEGLGSSTIRCNKGESLMNGFVNEIRNIKIKYNIED